MPPQNFDYETWKRTDSELVRALAKVAGDMGVQQLHIIPIAGISARAVAIDGIEEDAWLKDVFKDKGRALSVVQIQGQPSVTVREQADKALDLVNVGVGNTDDEKAFQLKRSLARHLPAIQPSTLSRVLGEEMAEFYQKREEGLLRLEDLSQRLIEESTSYRRQLDDESAAHRSRLSREQEARLNELEEEYKRKHEKLEGRQAVLEKREQELDDRSSRHARRGLRQDLKREISSRSQKFMLTKGTSRKRLLIHALFIAILALGLLFVYNNLQILPAGDQPFSPPVWWAITTRVALGIAALGATVVFYIRWNDQWFRQHSDEEFRLHRLQLDVDRASWVVEMMMEWQEEKGGEIPQHLIDRLTRNLFRDTEGERVRHPSEDLASALAEASSKLSLQLPGLGEATFDRRGLRRFKKAAKGAQDES